MAATGKPSQLLATDGTLYNGEGHHVLYSNSGTGAIETPKLYPGDTNFIRISAIGHAYSDIYMRTSGGWGPSGVFYDTSGSSSYNHRNGSNDYGVPITSVHHFQAFEMFLFHDKSYPGWTGLTIERARPDPNAAGAVAQVYLTMNWFQLKQTHSNGRWSIVVETWQG